MTFDQMSDEQYGFWFDVRRSVRYHDRRRAFFELVHRMTATLTVLLAGSVLFDIARPGDTPWWLIAISMFAALLAAADIVIGYSKCAGLHHDLKRRFSELEIAILTGGGSATEWAEHSAARLRIEQDEPTIYRALDVLCHNEIARGDGHDAGKTPAAYSTLGWWPTLTCQIWPWSDLRV